MAEQIYLKLCSTHPNRANFNADSPRYHPYVTHHAELYIHQRPKVDRQMEQKDIKILRLLEAIEKEPIQSQRKLAKALSTSLGTVNKFLSDLSIQGLITVDTMTSKKAGYILTSKGIAEKTKLASEHLFDNIGIYKKIKKLVKQRLVELEDISENCILFYGTGELCEIACVLSSQNASDKIKIIDDEKAGTKMCGFTIYRETEMENFTYEAVLIMGLENMIDTRTKLIDRGVPSNMIYPIISRKDCCNRYSSYGELRI
jgi:predicted transcriptional regulator